MKKRLTTALPANMLLIALMLTGCTSADPLAITCEEFMSKDAETQLELAARWAAPNREHVGAMEKMVAPQYRKDLLQYCPNHPKDKLNELELQIRPL
jgi:hypothetical protein